MRKTFSTTSFSATFVDAQHLFTQRFLLLRKKKCAEIILEYQRQVTVPKGSGQVVTAPFAAPVDLMAGGQYHIVTRWTGNADVAALAQGAGTGVCRPIPIGASSTVVQPFPVNKSM